MSFRAFLLTGCVAAAALAFGGAGLTQSASAQNLAFGSQAEWVQNYESVSRTRVARSATPILSPETLAATESMVDRYRNIVARGGWGRIANERLRMGSTGESVVRLRQRLIISGDLDHSAGGSQTFDSFVEAAVRSFQTRHGLTPTGALNGSTVAALNVPADVRLQQLELNVTRLRSYSGNLGDRYVITNIPSASVESVAQGEVVGRHAAGVGMIDRQSPIFNSRIVEINFNPYWTVPVSIIRKDLIPKMREDPTYLTDHKIRVFTYQGEELDPSNIDWNTDEGTRYMFRQDPGGDINSMGFVRINIPNPHGVYMHDTPSRGLFGEDFRFVSSGCVRVQSVRDFVTFLLAETDGWDRGAIDDAFRSGERLDARLSRPVNVYWTYITAWATPDGTVNFRDDIYERDDIQGVPVASAPGEAMPVH
ncbi:L,D-transpeptidase family protein [Saliniramus sp.]|uniref:L,D-transpeptidase family protein n=1 Tax=Saliniramus sp. TaxID=2986772 RepID=UPI002B71BEA6|nr:L,D-transpeptidase family protein [Saliniramus sp.]HMB09180.1 L,D-transpeptidase family protein [Saliniramus sp.]